MSALKSRSSQIMPVCGWCIKKNILLLPCCGLAWLLAMFVANSFSVGFEFINGKAYHDIRNLHGTFQARDVGSFGR